MPGQDETCKTCAEENTEQAGRAVEPQHSSHPSGKEQDGEKEGWRDRGRGG